VMGGQVDRHDGASPRNMHVRRRMIEDVDSTSNPASRMSVGTMRVYRRPWVQSTPPGSPAAKKRDFAVPEIVPVTRQDSASGANSSQLARSGKWK
jgi:hypothetical protein